MKISTRLFFLLGLVFLSGCQTIFDGNIGKQATITGEPLLYRVDPLTGELMDRDVLPTDQNGKLIGTVPHKGEMISISVKSIFTKFLADIGSPHVLIYATIDDGDGEDLSVLIYNHDAQPAGQSLGLSDKLIYGPTPFKGKPINIKLNIVELDKEDKQKTSQLLSVIGTVGASAVPQAAPALGIFVKIAESINALNEDDFELRYDMTLYPVGKIGTAKLARGGMYKDVGKDQISRLSKPISRVSSLQFGDYIIIKRELRDRSKKEVATSAGINYSQSAHLSGYLGRAEGEAYQVEELYRVFGGYLKRVVVGVKDRDGKSVNSAIVVPRTGDNAGIPIVIGPGYEFPFKDRTHVILSVMTGMGEKISDSVRQAASLKDAQTIASLLDDANNRSSAQDFGARLTELASAAHTTFELRRASKESAELVANDDTYRGSPDYVLYWTSLIDPLSGFLVGQPLVNQPQSVRNGIAKNSAVLTALNGLVYGLPRLDPKDPAKMTVLKALAAADVEARPNVTGRFQLTAAGKARF